MSIHIRNSYIYNNQSVAFSGKKGKTVAALAAGATLLAGVAVEGVRHTVPAIEKATPAITEMAAPEIGFWRIAFNRLKPAEIEKVNKEKILPDSAKFSYDCRNTGSTSTTCDWRIVNNLLGVQGTRQLPAGHELRQDCLGFTRVLPEGTEGFCIKPKS